LVFFGFFLADNRRSQLIVDLLESRSLTEDIIMFNYDWGVNFLEIDVDLKTPDQKDDVLYDIGGFYEVFYRCAKEKREFNLARHFRKPILALMIGNNCSHDLQDPKLSRDQLDAIYSEMWENTGADE